MKWNRFLSLLTAAVLTFSFTACGPSQDNSSKENTPPAQEESVQKVEEPAQKPEEPSKTPEEKPVIKVAALKGPTAFGMLDLMEKNENGSAQNQYEFTLVGAPDEIVGKISTGEADVAAVPTNLASVLYNKTQGKVQLAALNTLGVLYVLEKGDTIQSVEDLRGKTIYATGQGSTPEYALNMILEKNNLVPGTDVTVVYKTEHSEIPPLMASGEASIALLPQPFVTSVLMQNQDIRVALDITEEWNKAVDGASELAMGAIIVRKEFAEQNKDALNAFLDEYKVSAETVVKPENLEHAGALAEQFDIMKAPVVQKAIPECNIVFIDGEKMKEITSGFLQVLFDANPKSVGGALPDEAFYYTR